MSSCHYFRSQICFTENRCIHCKLKWICEMREILVMQNTNKTFDHCSFFEKFFFWSCSSTLRWISFVSYFDGSHIHRFKNKRDPKHSSIYAKYIPIAWASITTKQRPGIETLKRYFFLGWWEPKSDNEIDNERTAFTCAHIQFLCTRVTLRGFTAEESIHIKLPG